MRFKIIDLLVQEHGGSVTVRAKGYGGISRDLHASGDVSPLRAALMSSVFNHGRDCYWDDVKGIFSTTLNEYPNGDATSTLEAGRVDGWELDLSPYRGNIEFLLSLVHDNPKATSGSAATGFTRLSVAEDRAALVLSLVMARYCYSAPDWLRNTSILD